MTQVRILVGLLSRASFSCTNPVSDDRTRTIDLAGQRVPYAVRRSDRAKRARLTADLRGVTVVLPANSRDEPGAILRDHADWVREQHARAARLRAEVPERTFERGARFPYLGAPHEVVVESRSASSVEDGRLVLAEHHVEQTSIRRALVCLYRRMARDRFDALLEKHAPTVGVDDWQLEVRNQRTKWGSCSSTGTISLNWRLLLAPPAIGEYVVCHELVHRCIPHHGDAFWAALRAVMPEAEDHAAWLEANGHRLIFSMDDL